MVVDLADHRPLSRLERDAALYSNLTKAMSSWPWVSVVAQMYR